MNSNKKSRQGFQKQNQFTKNSLQENKNYQFKKEHIRTLKRIF